MSTTTARIINHTLLEGQIHGGIVQGIGQALGEYAHYDPATGQLVTGTFMDYAMPRADERPRSVSTTARSRRRATRSA